MKEFQLCILAFASWYVEKEQGREELADMWYNRFSELMDDFEGEYETLGEERDYD